MKLKQLISVLKVNPGFWLKDDFEVSCVASDSRRAVKDSLFVALSGTSVDGHDFIAEAIGKGARAVVIQQDRAAFIKVPAELKERALFITVPRTHKALGELAAEFYGRPSSKVRVAGITGTNGKTTVSYLIEAMLLKAGYLPAVIGTVNYRFKGRSMPAGNTTPGPLEIQKMLADIAREHGTHLVMEVSSHALHQERTEGVDFSSAIFTNLTQDHLDYHGTMEGYFAAKLKLFQGLTKSAFAVINNDQEQADRIKKATRAKVVTYGIDKAADVRAQGMRFSAHGTEFTAEAGSHTVYVRSSLIGRHNVYNMLAAIAWGTEEGVLPQTMAEALADFTCVPGRLQRVEWEGEFSVFIDYAHTDDALKNVITSLRQLKPSRIIVVFGCGGDRDRSKRPKMGQVASELADFCFITSDNPRSEEPADIAEDIRKGIRKDNYRVVIDRKEAINSALLSARAGDIVLIAGKGHENYQVYKGKTIPFDDLRVTHECLRSLRS